VQSTRFGLGDLINFSLASLADNPTTNPLLSPVLKQIGFEGDLDADISLSLDADDLSQSSGIVFLDFKSAELFFDKALTIPDQKFSKALMRGNIAGGQFTIDGNSGFVSDGIHLDFNGKVALRSRMDQSIMDLSISIKLFESLLEQFSFIVDAMTGGSRGGQLTLKIGGTLGQPSFNTI
jgi:type II secretion system protein N